MKMLKDVSSALVVALLFSGAQVDAGTDGKTSAARLRSVSAPLPEAEQGGVRKAFGALKRIAKANPLATAAVTVGAASLAVYGGVRGKRWYDKKYGTNSDSSSQETSSSSSSTSPSTSSAAASASVVTPPKGGGGPSAPNPEGGPDGPAPAPREGEGPNPEAPAPMTEVAEIEKLEQLVKRDENLRGEIAQIQASLGAEPAVQATTASRQPRGRAMTLEDSEELAALVSRHAQERRLAELKREFFANQAQIDSLQVSAIQAQAAETARRLAQIGTDFKEAFPEREEGTPVPPAPSASKPKRSSRTRSRLDNAGLGVRMPVRETDAPASQVPTASRSDAQGSGSSKATARRRGAASASRPASQALPLPGALPAEQATALGSDVFVGGPAGGSLPGAPSVDQALAAALAQELPPSEAGSVVDAPASASRSTPAEPTKRTLTKKQQSSVALLYDPYGKIEPGEKAAIARREKSKEQSIHRGGAGTVWTTDVVSSKDGSSVVAARHVLNDATLCGQGPDSAYSAARASSLAGPLLPAKRRSVPARPKGKSALEMMTKTQLAQAVQNAQTAAGMEVEELSKLKGYEQKVLIDKHKAAIAARPAVEKSIYAEPQRTKRPLRGSTANRPKMSSGGPAVRPVASAADVVLTPELSA